MGWYCLCLGVLCNQGVVVKLLAPVPAGDELMQSFPIIEVENQNPAYIIPMIDYIIIALEVWTTLKGHIWSYIVYNGSPYLNQGCTTK